MNVGIFAYTGDSAALETGVTTYNRVLVSELCLAYPDNKYFLYLSKNNASRYDDIEFNNLTKIVLNTKDIYAKFYDYRYLGFLIRIINEALSSLCVRRGFSPLGLKFDSFKNLDFFVYTVFDYLVEVPVYFKKVSGKTTISVLHDIRSYYGSIGRNSFVEYPYVCYWKRITKRMLKSSDLSLVTSNYIKNYVVEKFKLNKENVYVSYAIPNLNLGNCNRVASNDELIKKYNLPDKFIFYPSTIVKTKNHANIVRALGVLLNKGIVVHLVLCGTNAESRLYRDIKKIAESLGLSGCVLHIGFVDEGEKRAIYKLANSTVVPSIGESFCLSIWEAFWLGCPVVASSDRDIPEQVGDAALICDPLDPEDIAEKIRIFWEDDGLRSEYAKKGYDRVSSLSGQTLLGEWSGILSAH